MKEKERNGDLQDKMIMMRFHMSQIDEGYRVAIEKEFGEGNLTPEELQGLETVYVPFTCVEPEECDTQDEYDKMEKEHFAKIAELRPVFLRLLSLKMADHLEFIVSDLGSEKVEAVDAFLVAAFRFRLEV